jgi:KDO2-lipid IV(A) lauroyltransferase
MKKLLSYLTVAFLWTLAWVPTPLLYLLSDVLYLIIFHVTGYRKRVVRQNLANAYPEQSDAWRREIMRRFYRHLCDLIVEEIRMIHIPTRELLRRVEIRERDLERFEELKRQGVQAIVGAGHYGNWEWANAFVAQTSYYVMAIYKPLKDWVVEKLISRARLRWLDEVVPLHHVYRAILKYHREKIPTMQYFITDQTPLPFETEYVTRFLNQETAVYMGIEKVARKFNDPVFFLVMKKIKRGHYRLEIHDCCPDPAATEPYEITEKHVKMLEGFINEAPEYWLWSHRRWKYADKVREKKNVVYGGGVEELKS